MTRCVGGTLEGEEPVPPDAGGGGEDLLKVPRQPQEHRPLYNEDEPDGAHACTIAVDIRERHSHSVRVRGPERILAQLPQPPACMTSSNTFI